MMRVACLLLPLGFVDAAGLAAAEEGGSCSKCSGYTCDEWIAYDSSKYSCPELVRDYQCDCSGCQCTAPAPQPPASLMLFDASKYPTARCLDGSMGGYYLRKGAENKHVVFFEGGGWCYDDKCEAPTQEGTLGNCKDRSKGRLGSSSGWAQVQDASYLSGMLSADPSANPVFHNWTLVYAPYCDGTSFAGDAEAGGLHFRGRAIRDALVAEIKATLAIEESEQVVISGGSAGASAVFYHADTLAAALALKKGEVVALPDAGFFLDRKDMSGIDCWPKQMASVWNVSNGYPALHQGCLARFASEPWKCLYPEYYADLVQTRTLVLQSLYDYSEVSYTLRLDCEPQPAAGAGLSGAQPACKEGSPELRLFEAMGPDHIKSWKPLVSKKGNGVWAPACETHTMTWQHWTDATWEVPAQSGHTMAAVVQAWLANDDEDGADFVYEDVAWPGNKQCLSNAAGSWMV